MTTMIYFDTFAYVETLKGAGFSEKQAEAFMKVQQESLSECLDTTLATKADVTAVKTDVVAVKIELKAEIHELRSEMHEMKSEIWSEIRLLRWMMGVSLAGIGTLILKAFF